MQKSIGANLTNFIMPAYIFPLPPADFLQKLFTRLSCVVGIVQQMKKPLAKPEFCKRP